VKALLKLKITW